MPDDPKHQANVQPTKRSEMRLKERYEKQESENIMNEGGSGCFYALASKQANRKQLE